MALFRTVFLCALALAGGLSAASAASAAEDQAAACFAQHPPTHVSRYDGDVIAGDGTYTALLGAQLFVPAEQGLTAEWLHHQYLQRMAKRQSGSQCPLDLEGVRVSVQPAGPGYWVQLSASEEKTAKELLRRSQHWVPATAGR
jgi:hypothetical protein